MTTIKFHGFLKKKYGDSVKLNLGGIKNLINALESVKKDFRKTLIELNKNGQNYDFIFSKEKKEIEIVPSIIGSGKMGIIIAGVLLMVIGIGWALIAGFTLAMLIGGAGATWGSMIAGTLISTGISTIISGITAPSMPKMQQQRQSSGGGQISASSIMKSYFFNSNSGSMSQGSLIPIGYGRMKTGYKTIYLSTKNYSTDSVFGNEITQSQNAEIYG
jgi:predicted phage tail protein